MKSSAHSIEVLLAHECYVRALARRLVFDEDLARDVEQETWLAALQNAPQAASAPRAWLAAVVRSFAFKAFRARGRRDEHERAFGPREIPTDPAELLEREDARRGLVEAVAALDEPWRSTLILHFFDELSPAEIARRTQVPPKTVYARLERGLELLRERMSRMRGRERGSWALALVRGMRLEPASQSAVVAAAAKTLIQGAIVMGVVQKVVLGAAAIAVIAASLWFWQRNETVQAPAAGLEQAARPEVLPIPASGDSIATASSARESAELPSTAGPGAKIAPPADASLGSLLLHLVWGEDKTPAADVGMQIYHSAAADFYQDRLRARTASDGSLLFDPIQAGTLSLYFDRGSMETLVVKAGERTEKTVELPRGFDLSGTVRDAQDRAVAGAQIYVYGSMGDSYEGDVLAQSGTDGAYFVRSIASGGLTFISARAANRAPTPQKLVVSVTGSKIKVDLAFEDLGGRVEGRVLSPDGSPCAAAAVVIEDSEGMKSLLFPDGFEGRGPASQRAFADEQGRYRFDGVGEGVRQVQARAKGLAPWKGEVSVLAGRNTPLSITLEQGAKLEGAVRDDQGAAVAGVQVTAGGSYGFRACTRKTRKDGSFSFDCVPLGEIEVAVESEGRGSASATLFAVSGETLHWDALLARGLVLRGRIQAPGRELGDWWLNITAPGASEPFMHMARTDKAGRFEALGCPDHPLRLEVHAPDGARWPIAIVENVRAGGAELVIEPDPALEPNIHIHGRVVDPDHKPLGGVQIIPGREGFNTSPILTSNLETGGFDLGPYPSGNWQVRIKSPGFADLVTEPRRISSGETWDCGDLVMQPGGNVLAHLRREAGVSADPVIILTSAAGQRDWLFLDGDTARSGVLAPGHYELQVGGAGIALAGQQLEVRAGEETEVDVALRGGLPVLVRFVDAQGKPLTSGVHCEIRDAHGLLCSLDVVPGFGPIEVSSHLLPGSYRFRASHADGRGGELELELAGDRSSPRVERDLTIR